MKRSLTEKRSSDLVARVVEVDRHLQSTYPGESGARQPVHTVYGGAQLFRAGTARKLGELALSALDTYGADATTFVEAAELGVQGELAHRVYERVRSKLEREPVEDFRIDFEDGYGHRPDDEEDAEAIRTAGEVAVGMKEGMLPPFMGIRVKPLTAELGRRSIRTLDLFVTALAEKSGGAFPKHFVVTLPKVIEPHQVSLFVEALEAVEEGAGLAPGALRMELMIEMPQAIVGADGRSALPLLLEAAQGRCVAAHFGTYDYTAGCSITAAYQHMMHPVCDFAKHMMQVSYAGRGIWLSDGATNVMPVPVCSGESLSQEERRENAEAVHRAWRLHASHVRHSLETGFYQGWDLHPAQLPTRYGTVYAFFLASLDAAAERLTNFVDKAAQATLVGDVFDDAATGQGLLNFFLRAVGCGAITEAEATELSSLSTDELQTRSFAKIVAGRSD